MAVVHTDLSRHLPLVATGKVRELYALDDGRLLFVATDRISGIGAAHEMICISSSVAIADAI